MGALEGTDALRRENRTHQEESRNGRGEKGRGLKEMGEKPCKQMGWKGVRMSRRGLGNGMGEGKILLKPRQKRSALRFLRTSQCAVPAPEGPGRAGGQGRLSQQGGCRDPAQ